MAKPKIDRSLKGVGQAQQEVEKQVENKFDTTQDLAQGKKIQQQTAPGRVSPQISCTVLPEDKQMLNDITIFAINKAGRPLNTSSIIRALIRLGHKRKEELEF